jgi:5-methylthioadenosine/S-adenosylhomocysteine deaminase
MTERTLLKGGAVLTLDPAIGNFSQADVLIEGDKILDVGRNLTDNEAKLVDVSHMVVMPGFIDTHRHMWQGLLRNAGTAYLSKNPGYENGSTEKMATRFRPADVYASTLSSALGALDAGITTVLNYSDIGLTEEHTKADLDAIRKAGLRSVFAVAPAIKGDDDARLAAFRGFVEANFASRDLVTPALASRGPEYESLDYLKREWALARELKLRITTQVGMGENGRKEGFSQAAKAALLKSDVLYAHCNTLTDGDLHQIKTSDGEVSIAPSAEMMLGYGQPTVQRMLDAKIQPSLGVDSEGASRGDLFNQMRAAISMQHAMSFEKKLARRFFPAQITTRDVIEFATVAGARALGMLETIGTLSPGKQADIVLLSQYHINVMPINDPIGAVVWAMDTSNVDTVMVAGKILKRDGQLVDADLAELRNLTAEASKHVLGAAIPA